jgi:hypothetical protein
LTILSIQRRKDLLHLSKNIIPALETVAKLYNSRDFQSKQSPKLELQNIYPELTRGQMEELLKNVHFGTNFEFICEYLKFQPPVEKEINLTKFLDSSSKKALEALNVQIRALESETFKDLQEWLDSKVDCNFSNTCTTYRDKLDKKLMNANTTSMVESFKNSLARKNGWPNHTEFAEKVMKKDFIKEHFAGTSQTDIIQKWSKYFDINYLKKKYANIIVLAGGKVEDLTSILSEFDMAEQRYLKILQLKKDSGQDYIFSQPSEAKFVVEIKGISKIQVSVYEVDMENYLRNNPAVSQPTNIECKGFKPHHYFTKSYDHSQLLQFEETIDLSGVLPRQGTYVVKVVGGGQFIQLVFTIGCLAVVREDRDQTAVFYAIEKNTKLPIKDFSIWVDSDQFNSDKETGQVSVPHEKLTRNQSTSLPAIVKTPTGVCQRLWINTINSNTPFMFWPLYNPSALGSLQPYCLTLFPTPFHSPEELEATITYTSIEGTKTVKQAAVKQCNSFPDAVKLEDVVADRCFEFEVKLTSLRLKKSQSTRIPVTAISTTIESLSMTVTEDKYLITARGINGEALTARELSIDIETRFLAQSQSWLTMTDNQGCVELPKVPGVTKIIARILNSQVKAEWKFSIDSNLATLNSSIVLREGQVVNLPLDQTAEVLPAGVSSFELMRISHEGNSHKAIVEEVLTEKVKVLKESNDQGRPGFNSVQLKNLTPGTYRLTYLFSNKTVEITVLKDIQPISGYVLGDNNLRPLSSEPVILSQVAITSKSETVAEASISLSGWCGSPPLADCSSFKFLSPVVCSQNASRLKVRSLLRPAIDSDRRRQVGLGLLIHYRQTVGRFDGWLHS